MTDALRAFRIDWEKVLKERFPNGVEPIETPLMKLITKETKAK